MLNEELELVTLDEVEERLVWPAPVLITEQEVALGTAAALRTRPSTRRRWIEAIRGLLAAVEHAIVAPTDDRPPRRDYPKRYAFLENACMSREMDRL
jgi:hypothetical protein